MRQALDFTALCNTVWQSFKLYEFLIFGFPFQWAARWVCQIHMSRDQPQLVWKVICTAIHLENNRLLFCLRYFESTTLLPPQVSCSLESRTTQSAQFWTFDILLNHYNTNWIRFFVCNGMNFFFNNSAVAI